MTIPLYLIPTALTIIPWLIAYIKDKSNPDFGSYLAYAALGSTLSSWIFYGILWVLPLI